MSAATAAPVAIDDIDSLKRFLREGGQNNIHDHLVKILMQYIKSRNYDLNSFENLSQLLKSCSPPSSSLLFDGAQRDAVLSAMTTLSDTLKKPKKYDEDGQEEEEEEEEMNEQAPDLIQEFEWFSQAGVSLSSEELELLSLAFQAFCNTTPALVTPRFWGKVFGTQQDYYIIETKLDEYPDDEEEEAPAPDEPDEDEPRFDDEEEATPKADKTEPWGTGVNEYVYYACNSLLKPQWTRLPKLTPEQLIVSRGTQRFLSGLLNAPIYGFPRFPWGEAAYLRAQIARISHSTILAPKDALVGDEEDRLIALENEEWRPARGAFYLSPTSWLHARVAILKEGRIEPFVDENEEEPDEDDMSEVEREKYRAKLAAKEKPLPVLLPIASDVLSRKSGKASKRQLWRLGVSSGEDVGSKRVVYPPEIEEDEQPRDESFTSVTAHASSTLWPGAVNVVQHKQYRHVYVGWGLKARGAPYRPAGPPKPQNEYVNVPVTKKGVSIDLLKEQTDVLPPADRPQEELDEEAEEERQRQARADAENEEEALEEDENDTRRRDEEDDE